MAVSAGKQWNVVGVGSVWSFDIVVILAAVNLAL